MAKLPYKQMMDDTAQVRHLRSDPFYRNLLRVYPAIHMATGIPMAARRCLSTFPVRPTLSWSYLYLRMWSDSRGHTD